MRHVFIVTSGAYSDYRISGVFSTKELAEEYVQLSGSDSIVEEYLLDEPINKTDDALWRVLLNIENHNVLSCEIVNYFEYIDRIDGVSYHEYHEGKCLMFYLRADTKERAIKIANERLNQVLCGRDMFYRRVFVEIIGCFGRGYPIVDYNTGEII